MTAHTLILGIGSPDPDDCIGWEIADSLRRPGLVPSGVHIEACDRPGVGLLEYFRRAPRVILIDAMHAGLAPGSVRVLRPEQLESPASLSSHDLGVAEAVALAEALGELPDRLAIIGIEAGADPAVSMPRAHAEVKRLLELHSA